MNSKFTKFETTVFVLLFSLLAVFLIHNFDSIGQDIGRHLKIGEIIWQTKEVPKVNLFSFTEPDFPFTNHHWLSEVIFFNIFSLFGFSGLILFKAFLVLAAFLLLFLAVKNLAKFWPILISFLLSVFIFISRTEARPEIFSFVILAFFLFAIFRAKYSNNYFYLWFLPILGLLWVNLHIYFFVGPFLMLSFLIDQAINRKNKPENVSLKKVALILSLVFAATLANPNGIQGALLPFSILKEYGYSIVENQTLSFLADFFGFNLSIFVFKLSVAVAASLLVITFRKTRQRIFEILILVFSTYAGFKMLRNLPLYAFISFPVMAILLSDVSQGIKNKLVTCAVTRRMSRVFKIAIAVFLFFMIFWVSGGGYYKATRSSKVFGFSVPGELEKAVNFVKENKLEGPMFNNFDIGGYLIWKLYPDYKLFVDNRPEAYSVKFFSEIYKPMQESKEKWKELSEKYGINFIFFAHTDATPWGQTFIKSIVRDSDWKVVFINNSAIILVKNIPKNEPIFSKYKYEFIEK